MKITVLGAGRVGSAIVRDLAGEFTVTAADASEAALARLAGLAKVKTVRPTWATSARSPGWSPTPTSSSARCPGSWGSPPWGR